MSTSICWELTCDGLVSHPGGVKDSHPITLTTETGETKTVPTPWATCLIKDLASLASLATMRLVCVVR